eukprot:gene2012-biopygen3395
MRSATSRSPCRSPTATTRGGPEAPAPSPPPPPPPLPPPLSPPPPPPPPRAARSSAPKKRRVAAALGGCSGHLPEKCTTGRGLSPRSCGRCATHVRLAPTAGACTAAARCHRRRCRSQKMRRWTLARAWRGRGAGVARATGNIWLGWRGRDVGMARAWRGLDILPRASSATITSSCQRQRLTWVRELMGNRWISAWRTASQARPPLVVRWPCNGKERPQRCAKTACDGGCNGMPDREDREKRKWSRAGRGPDAGRAIGINKCMPLTPHHLPHPPWSCAGVAAPSPAVPLASVPAAEMVVAPEGCTQTAKVEVRDASGTHLPLGDFRAARARCRSAMTSTGTMKGWKAASSTLSAQAAFNANRSLSVVQYSASGPPPGNWKSTVSTCDAAFVLFFTWAAPAAPPLSSFPPGAAPAAPGFGILLFRTAPAAPHLPPPPFPRMPQARHDNGIMSSLRSGSSGAWET